MDNDELLEMAGDSQFIEGIYNYCDRWCEQCPLTSRCLLYATEQVDDPNPATRYRRNEAFWRKFQDTFQMTHDLINSLADERSIDLNSSDIEAVAKEIGQRRERTEENEMSQSASDYAEAVEEWFKREDTLVESIEIILKENMDDTDISRNIADSFAVIRWYQFQIAAKIMRGLSQREVEAEEPQPDWQKDSDGSIKIALIGMDRSINAWGSLRDIMPDKSKSVLPMLTQLEQMRRQTEKEFPSARNFLRLGFDMMPGGSLN